MFGNLAIYIYNITNLRVENMTWEFCKLCWEYACELQPILVYFNQLFGKLKTECHIMNYFLIIYKYINYIDVTCIFIVI